MASRRNYYQFTCGKADTKLNAWLSSPLNTCKSHLIREAVEYFARTGKYYLIGKVHEPEKGQIRNGKVCNISIPQNSDFEKWYNTELEKGRSIAPVVKKILYNSIVYTEGEEFIPSRYDDLLEVDENLKKSSINGKHGEKEEKQEEPKKEKVKSANHEEKKYNKTAFVQLLKADLDKGFGFED